MRLVLGLLAAVLVPALAAAQLAPPRTWPELKAETQRRADAQAYPCEGLDPADVRDALSHIDSLDRDQWAAAFSAVGDRHAADARALETTNAPRAAQEWMEAWRDYAFARWPVPNSPGKQAAYQKSLSAFLAYANHLSPKLEVVRIPFQGKEIVAYLRVPPSAAPTPLVILSSALDSRKEDAIVDAAAYLPHGIAILAVDMPGTGQSPVKAEPGAEKMYEAVLDWVPSRADLDAKRVVIQGTSWSGYWAAKLGIMDANRLRAAVVQGGPVDDYFSAAWQAKALGTREYLFDLFPARASIYGVTTLDDFLAYGPRMSLEQEGLLDKPSAPMLVLNGVKDSQVPISDLDKLTHHGTAKSAWVNPQGFHTGRGPGWSGDRILQEVIIPWVQQQVSPSEAKG
jgi:esterase FrsA